MCLVACFTEDCNGCNFSNNYGGALGANALGKGLEGNKSLRVNYLFLPFCFLKDKQFEFFLTKKKKTIRILDGNSVMRM